MKKRAINILGIILFITGIIFLLSLFPSITGFAIFEGISTNLGIVVGFIFVVIGIIVIFMSRHGKESKLVTIAKEETDKKSAIRQLREEIEDFDGDYGDAIVMVVDTLANIRPEYGFKGRESLRNEKRELRYIANLLHRKYGVSTNEVYRALSKDLHSEKKKYGRKGR